jgi:multicomponent Na+:H+ antiporter subunit A
LSVLDRATAAFFALLVFILAAVILAVMTGWLDPLAVLDLANLPLEYRISIGLVTAIFLLLALRLLLVSMRLVKTEEQQALIDSAALGAVSIAMPALESLIIRAARQVSGVREVQPRFKVLAEGLVVLYSIYYLSKEREALQNFYVYLLLFMAAMLGVVFSDNIIVLYMFWELTSIASFLLIAYWYQRKSSRYGAQKALLITMFGGFLMLGGFLLLANVTDTFSIREMILQAGKIKEHTVFFPAMVLILLGAFTKSAQFPFHIWLPDAMEAPTPISAYLHSATMVKAGIYLIARFTPIFGGSMAWFLIVSGTGLFTLFWGAFSAVNQKDLKAMLAFSTVSQLGMITCLLGLGSAAMYYGPGAGSALYTTAVLAAVFHLVNHSTFKGCLFMVVGIIDHQTGTRDIRRLGGLMSLMPITFTLAVIGSFSMAGLPPFNGFLSKEMFFTSVLNITRLDIFHMETWGILFPVIAWYASTSKKAVKAKLITIAVRISACGSGSVKTAAFSPNKAGPPVLRPPIVIISRWVPWAIIEVPNIIRSKLFASKRYTPIAKRIPMITDISVSIC